MIRASLALALLAASTATAAQDNRIVERFYDAGKVVRIDGKAKVQATIQFAEDERIENVAIGDSEAWQVTPNKRANLLFVKPLATTASTNMTVVTDRRTYLFDLVASASAKLYDHPLSPFAQLPLSQRISDALLNHHGPYASYLDVARHMEDLQAMGDLPLICHTHEFRLDDVNRALIRMLCQVKHNPV